MAKLTRRAFRKASSSRLASAADKVYHALVVEPRWVRVTRPVVKVPYLPAAWDGVRIAHLTDLHFGRLANMTYMRRIAEITNQAKPDIVVLTGDFASKVGVRRQEGLMEMMSSLQGPEGKFAVLGNHDHWNGRDPIEFSLMYGGVKVLTNRHQLLDRQGQKLCLAGVDDLWEGHADLAKALRGVAEQCPRVLLCHNPGFAERMGPRPRVDLMLCGHTHGGQVHIGRRLLLWHSYKYAAGLIEGPHCQVYTSVGLGMVALPIRVNCRPEIAIITLRRAG
jgi:predicted MPP superfamily phosphohydrolase